MDAARFQEPRRRMIPIRSASGDGEMSVLDFGDASRPVDLVFAHANGFNAQTYRSMLAPLSAGLRIVAPDLRGHGSTRLKAQAAGRRSWKDYRDDLIGLLDALGGPPVTLAGHSMGAVSMLLAAERRPDRASNLVLFDPVIWSPMKTALMALPFAPAFIRWRAPIVRSASRRRSVFDSRQAAFDSYRGRGVFKSWPGVMLADYVAGGFHEREDGKVELSCAPEWEASNFAAQDNHPWRALARLDRPVHILRASQGSLCALQPQSGFLRRRPDLRVSQVEGGHHFALERPDVAREALLDAAV